MMTIKANNPTDSGTEASPRRSLILHAPTILLWIFILAYILFFSAYSLQLHATLNSFAADLSFIDQPMWNSLHGRFLERTLGDQQVPRVAEHFEPIIVPIALVFYLWDDVRAILIIQTLALALGAVPVYWIARKALSYILDEHGGAETHTLAEPVSHYASLLALSFVVAYLMFPEVMERDFGGHPERHPMQTPYGVGQRCEAEWQVGQMAEDLLDPHPVPSMYLVSRGIFLKLVDGTETVRMMVSPGGLRSVPFQQRPQTACHHGSTCELCAV